MAHRLRNPLFATAVLALGMTAGWFARGWVSRVAESGERAAAGRVQSQAPRHPQSLPHFDDGEGAVRKPSPTLELLREFGKEMSEADLPAGGRFEASQFGAYLNRHERDARSLLTVWVFTKDEALLREAYEKKPDDLIVGLTAFQSLPLSAQEKQDLAQRLRNAHPRNVVGSLLAASLASARNEKTEFRALLTEMQQRPDLDFEIRARSLASREALMSAGKSPLEARIVTYSRGVPIPLEEFMAVGKAGLGEIQRLIAAGGTDEAVELAGQLMALGRRLQEEPGRTQVAALTGFSVQAAGLSKLPDDIEVGETGRTPKQEIAFLRSQFCSPSDWNASVWHLQHFDEAGAELYFQIREELGDREALKWAEAYHGPAPRAEPTGE